MMPRSNLEILAASSAGNLSVFALGSLVPSSATTLRSPAASTSVDELAIAAHTIVARHGSSISFYHADTGIEVRLHCDVALNDY